MPWIHSNEPPFRRRHIFPTLDAKDYRTPYSVRVQTYYPMSRQFDGAENAYNRAKSSSIISSSKRLTLLQPLHN